jgi:antitoxin ParD1/3/4
VEERDALEAANLKALRGAAAIGLKAIESGRFRAFRSFEELRDYLKVTTDSVIAGTAAN